MGKLRRKYSLFNRRAIQSREKNIWSTIKSKNEHTLYKKGLENGEILLISLYVDDIIYTSYSSVLLEQFKSDMMNILLGLLEHLHMLHVLVMLLLFPHLLIYNY